MNIPDILLTYLAFCLFFLVEYKPHESRDFDLFIMYVPRAISGLEKSLSEYQWWKEGVSTEWRVCLLLIGHPRLWAFSCPSYPRSLASRPPQGAALTFSLCSCSLLTRASSWAFLLLRASMRASHCATRQASNSTLFSYVREHSVQQQSDWVPWAARDSRAPVHLWGEGPAEGKEEEPCPQCTHVFYK